MHFAREILATAALARAKVGIARLIAAKRPLSFFEDPIDAPPTP